MNTSNEFNECSGFQVNLTNGFFERTTTDGLSQRFGDLYLLQLNSQRDSKLWNNKFFVFIICDNTSWTQIWRWPWLIVTGCFTWPSNHLVLSRFIMLALNIERFYIAQHQTTEIHQTKSCRTERIGWPSFRNGRNFYSIRRFKSKINNSSCLC